jgi:hypothetical protein
MVSILDVVQLMDVPLFKQNSDLTIIDIVPGQNKIVIGSESGQFPDYTPISIAGYEVVMVRFPRMYSLPCGTCTSNAPYSCDPSRTNDINPVCAGTSVGHYKITAGTIGAIVKDNITGKKAILSNNHVLACSSAINSPHASQGDPIYQPGVFDGGSSVNKIATLTRWVPLDPSEGNIVDCALAELTVDSVEGWLSDTNGTILPENGHNTQVNIGDICKKYGRTTGYTVNTVISTTASFSINYPTGVMIFKNQIVFTANDGYENPICGGDSGSALLNDKNEIIGLCFAGGDNVGIACPIDPVLGLLDITIPSKNPEPQICVQNEVKCDGYHRLICDNNKWLDQGVNPACGSLCEDGTTKCQDGRQYLCQTNEWLDQGVTSTCSGVICEPGVTKCVGERKFLCSNNEWLDQGINSDCQTPVPEPTPQWWNNVWLLPAGLAVGMVMFGGKGDSYVPERKQKRNTTTKKRKKES